MPGVVEGTGCAVVNNAELPPHCDKCNEGPNQRAMLENNGSAREAVVLWVAENLYSGPKQHPLKTPRETVPGSGRQWLWG